MPSRHRPVVVLLALVAVSVLPACGAVSPDIPVEASPSHWGYAEAEGPTSWGALSPDFETCDSGRRQSPIDLPQDETPTTEAGALVLADAALSGDADDNGHTVQFGADGTVESTYRGEEYALQQMHFHTPSEHTVGGTRYPVEFHFVQTHGDDTLVLSVFGIEGAEAEGDWAAIAEAAHSPGPHRLPALRAADLLPPVVDYYSYEGSLTTPPCTEGVRWVVLTSPVSFSAAQLEELSSAHDGNDRPVQPLGDRTVAHVSDPEGLTSPAAGD